VGGRGHRGPRASRRLDAAAAVPLSNSPGAEVRWHRPAGAAVMNGQRLLVAQIAPAGCATPCGRRPHTIGDWQFQPRSLRGLA